jgi:hypothetical protein
LAYIGVQPAEAYTSFAVQHFTTSATDTFTLDFPVANENEIALFINNVRQEPGSSYAYTASGTTLTLSSAITGSDSMYCVFIGKAVQTVAPAAGSVTGGMMSYPLTNFSSTGIDDNATSTAVTIDSSGNVLVGMAAVSGSTDGLHFRPGIASGINVTNDHTIALNRKSTDGEILRFLKDSSLVGSIDVSSSGISIKLGGTGSANALDDYEEGTWTPTFGGAGSDPSSFSWNVQSGTYTKVGNQVFARAIVYPSSFSGGSGNWNVRSLPFTANANSVGTMWWDRIRIQAGQAPGLVPRVLGTTSYMEFPEMNDGSGEASTRIQVDDLAGNFYLELSIVYTTDS